MTCGVALSFNVEHDEFVQILNNCNGHWLTVTTIGCPHLMHNENTWSSDILHSANIDFSILTMIDGVCGLTLYFSNYFRLNNFYKSFENVNAN